MPKGEYVRKNKTTAVKVWSRGDEIPPTLQVSEFMNGIGVEPETLTQIQTKAKVQPLYMRAPGQTKGYPSLTVFTKDQVEQLLSMWDTMHAPAPPTMEQRILITLQDVETAQSRQAGTITHLPTRLDQIQHKIDGLTTKIEEGFLSIRTMLAQMRETHTEPTFQPLPVDSNNANEVPSQMAGPEPARPILRRKPSH